MAKRPNLVFIMSDQQRSDTMACYGNDWIQTPRLNAFASQSFVFQNAYVTQPVCTPARASIMTGLYPHAAGPTMNKMHLPPDIPTIAEMLSDDYLCGYYGKWHLGNDVIQQRGFDKWLSAEDGHRAEYSKKEYRSVFSDYHKHLVSNGFEPDEKQPDGALIFSPNRRSELPEEFQMASFLADRSAAFIEDHKDEPFVLYVSTYEPHSPNNSPLNDLYDPGALPVGPAFLKRPDGTSLLNRVRADYYMGYMGDAEGMRADPYMAEYASAYNDISTEEGWRIVRARYFACVTLVDRMVGKILDALDRAGVADNTVVVFTSEHGDMMGDHGLLEKRSFYEEASKVPLLLRAPWLSREQRIIGGSIGQIDLVPTLLELLGDPVPGHLQGQSRAAVLRGEETLEGNDVFIQWNGASRRLGERSLGIPAINRAVTLPWRSVVSDRWKLNLCSGDQCELFDMNTDPHELNNLYDDPAQRDRIRDLAARIRLRQLETGDDVALPTV